MELIEAAVERLRSAGWSFAPASAETAPVAAASSSVASWVTAFSHLTTADETTRFLAAGDYTASSADAFAWNTCEMLSTEAASTDEERALITAFWSRHLPILLSVRGHIAYLAVRDDGAVVHGEEPEFEETTVVAPSLESALSQIAHRSTPHSGLIDALVFPAA